MERNLKNSQMMTLKKFGKWFKIKKPYQAFLMEKGNWRNKMSDQLEYLKIHAPELFGKVRLEQFFDKE